MSIPDIFGGRAGRGRRRPQGRRRLTVAIVALSILGFIILPWAATVAADLLWFREIGYQVVWIREFTIRGLLFLGVGILAYAFIRANVVFAQRGPMLQPALFVGEV